MNQKIRKQTKEVPSIKKLLLSAEQTLVEILLLKPRITLLIKSV